MCVCVCACAFVYLQAVWDNDIGKFRPLQYSWDLKAYMFSTWGPSKLGPLVSYIRRHPKKGIRNVGKTNPRTATLNSKPYTLIQAQNSKPEKKKKKKKKKTLKCRKASPMRLANRPLLHPKPEALNPKP